jgi:protocatechuate 3,4-dioxygenase beta subunit
MLTLPDLSTVRFKYHFGEPLYAAPLHIHLSGIGTNAKQSLHTQLIFSSETSPLGDKVQTSSLTPLPFP